MTFWDFANAHAEGLGMLFFSCVLCAGFFAFMYTVTRGQR